MAHMLIHFCARPFKPPRLQRRCGDPMCHARPPCEAARRSTLNDRVFQSLKDRFVSAKSPKSSIFLQGSSKWDLFGGESNLMQIYGHLTWPMAKLYKLFGIPYLVGKISRSNFFFGVHWLSESFCGIFPYFIVHHRFGFILYKWPPVLVGYQFAQELPWKKHRFCLFFPITSYTHEIEWLIPGQPQNVRRYNP